MKRCLLLFRLDFVYRIKYFFPAKHRLHTFVVDEYGCALSIISYDKLYSVFESFNFHINSIKVVF